jgi:hypothetical protein
MCSISVGSGSAAGLSMAITVAVGLHYAVFHRGRGEDDVHVVLALEALLDDLHVKEAQETEAVTKAQRLARLRLVGERGVVELQFLQRVAQIRCSRRGCSDRDRRRPSV